MSEPTASPSYECRVRMLKADLQDLIAALTEIANMHDSRNLSEAREKAEQALNKLGH